MISLISLSNICALDPTQFCQISPVDQWHLISTAYVNWLNLAAVTANHHDTEHKN